MRKQIIVVLEGGCVAGMYVEPDMPEIELVIVDVEAIDCGGMDAPEHKPFSEMRAIA